MSRTISKGYCITMTLRREHNLYSKKENAKKQNENISLDSRQNICALHFLYSGNCFKGHIYPLISGTKMIYILIIYLIKYIKKESRIKESHILFHFHQNNNQKLKYHNFSIPCRLINSSKFDTADKRQTIYLNITMRNKRIC